MATTEIPWGDGSGGKIYLTYASASGNQTVVVTSDANAGAARSKTITFTSGVGNITRTLTINQERVAEPYIVFADSLVEQICATKWGDGIGITPSQAAAVTNSQLGTTFRNNTGITSFDEFVYFTGITELSTNAFSGCSALTSIVLPPNVTTLGNQVFNTCSSLARLGINSAISTGSNCFRNTAALKRLDISSLEAYLGCTWGSGGTPSNSSNEIHLYMSGVELTQITIPATVTTIKYAAFRYCTSLTSITMGNNVTSVANSAFERCSGLTNLTIYGTCTGCPWYYAGNNTGTLTVNGDITLNGGQRNYLNFKNVIVNGNIYNSSTSGTQIQWSFGSQSPTSIRISGNIQTNTQNTNGYFYSATQRVIEFIEIGGSITTYGSNPLLRASWYKSGAVVHLGYNGVVIDPSFLRVSDSNLSKVYVDSQTVLNAYLADSAWSAYASKLDLWSNYNGDYKD